MCKNCKQTEETSGEFIELRILIDDLTAARLMEIADNAHADPRSVAAAILRDVLEDDAQAHFDGPFDPPAPGAVGTHH